jgi:hypothetical protein
MRPLPFPFVFLIYNRFLSDPIEVLLRSLLGPQANNHVEGNKQHSEEPGSYLTGNTLRLRYKAKPVNDM